VSGVNAQQEPLQRANGGGVPAVAAAQTLGAVAVPQVGDLDGRKEIERQVYVAE
jgi:hypothetical protein